MSRRDNLLLAGAVQRHFEQLGKNCAYLEDLLWLLERWNIVDHCERRLIQADIRCARKIIATVPTGKQRHYKQALNDILFYLQDACHWRLPEQEQVAIRDTEYGWFESIAKQSQKAHQIFENFQQQKKQYFVDRGTLSPAFIALMIGFEIAPLSLSHIGCILNDITSITSERPIPRLRLTHQNTSKDELRVTHYHLPLTSYRLLSDYYAQPSKHISEFMLFKQLSKWLVDHGLSQATRAEWSKRFQITWYLHHYLPPILLKDLANPERHVSLPLNIQSSRHQLSEIYTIDWDANWFMGAIQSKNKHAWPHKLLLKSHASQKKPPLPPRWDANNLLPRLLYDYTQQLLTHGGVKKSTLAVSSIIKYTQLEHILNLYPLTYAQAIDEASVNLWAKNIFDSLNGDALRQTFFYFLRFLSHQEQTDSIDLTLFTMPTTAPSVSAGRLDLIELDTLIQALITQNTTHPLRSLFTVIAALLGYFGMLRRGEVLRLRCQDVQFVPKTGLLTLFIANTKEGRTKSGLSRTVYTTIPSPYRKLFQVIKAIKEGTSLDCPLIGFDDEKYHSRQLYYLLPITRALKILFGTHMHFHHLRHSGVHVFMIQMLHFVSRTPENERGNTPLECEVLSQKSICTRFEYWLEGRSPDEANDGIFFDEVCKQIGHTNYATTRWSYLHDIDWLLPIISTEHRPYTLRSYSHSELRYLLGLSSTSHNLARKLKTLRSNITYKMLGDKRIQPIQLTNSQLRSAIFGQSQQQIEQQSSLDHFRNWQNTIYLSTNTLIGFLFKAMQSNGCLELATLSKIWSQSCQHDITPVGKKQRTALSKLPQVELSEGSQALQITLACNVKNARAFTSFFRHKDWAWLSCQFELTAHRNLNRARQITLLKEHFVQSGEAISVKNRSIGKTMLTITLRPKFSISNQTLMFTQQFIHSLQFNKDTL